VAEQLAELLANHTRPQPVRAIDDEYNSLQTGVD
jgi:hypothetical protein